jgi:hypothetical protein
MSINSGLAYTVRREGISTSIGDLDIMHFLGE